MTAGKRRWPLLLALLTAAAILLGALSLYGDRLPLPGGIAHLMPAPLGEGLTVEMLDVGQAQAILLSCGGRHALVDAGLGDTAKDVISHLARRGVKKLDYLFITHPHSDHCGGAAKVTGAVRTDVLLFPRFLSEELALATAGDWVGASDTALDMTFAGKQYPLGEATVTVLHPTEDNQIDDMNLLSLVLLVEYEGRRVLLTGDLTAQGEAGLLPLKPVDVLQVAHHGSDSSSSEAFLQAVSPDIALISCGKNNDYGHPHGPVLDRLEEVGAKVYRTDLEGTVTVRVTGEGAAVEGARATMPWQQQTVTGVGAVS